MAVHPVTSQPLRCEHGGASAAPCCSVPCSSALLLGVRTLFTPSSWDVDPSGARGHRPPHHARCGDGPTRCDRRPRPCRRQQRRHPLADNELGADGGEREECGETAHLQAQRRTAAGLSRQGRTQTVSRLCSCCRQLRRCRQWRCRRRWRRGSQRLGLPLLDRPRRHLHRRIRALPGRGGAALRQAAVGRPGQLPGRAA